MQHSKRHGMAFNSSVKYMLGDQARIQQEARYSWSPTKSIVLMHATHCVALARGYPFLREAPGRALRLLAITCTIHFLLMLWCAGH